MITAGGFIFILSTENFIDEGERNRFSFFFIFFSIDFY